PFGLPFLEQLDRALVSLYQRIEELWRSAPDAEEIVLHSADLETAVENLPPPSNPCSSVSLFTQLVRGGADGPNDGQGPPGAWEGRGPALVARSYLTGFGKYFSRFLYLLPAEVLSDLRATNRRLTDQELAEICGDANFNANLHPALLPDELAYPTAEGAGGEQIATWDLRVEPDPEDVHRLRLVRASSGKEIVPVDLGFLNPRMRPPLFQLLSRFTPSISFNLPLPESPGTGVGEGGDGRSTASGGVEYRPRITYRGRLILARRRWRITHEAFPYRRSGEGEGEYFLRLQEWRQGLGLPAEVFVRIDLLPPSAGDSGNAPREPAAGPVRQHLYKPQYLDFECPLLVHLFEKTGESLRRFRMSFEERLPAHEHLIPAGSGDGLDDERYAVEMVFQIDSAGGGMDV
ncbi:MAG: lantibiotic dehydratase family protein, partial [Holophagales bacterium]|nr:lantibiotic dehydratase family protein [Holophagales bacterium]